MTKSELKKLKTNFYLLERCLSTREFRRIRISKRIARIKKLLNQLLKENTYGN